MPSPPVPPIVFIAGPFRAPTPWRVEQHIRRAESLALAVWRLDAVALCPHMNTRHFDGELPDFAWLGGCLVLLARCDAVLTVDGWERSQGATAEVQRAREIDIPVFHDLDRLREWIAVRALHGQRRFLG